MSFTKMMTPNLNPQYKVGDVVILKEKMGCSPSHEPPYWVVVSIESHNGSYCLKFPHGANASNGVSIASWQHDSDIIGLHVDQNVPEKDMYFLYAERITYDKKQKKWIEKI